MTGKSISVAHVKIMSKTYFSSTTPLKQNSITTIILAVITSFDNHLGHSCLIRAHD